MKEKGIEKLKAIQVIITHDNFDINIVKV